MKSFAASLVLLLAGCATGSGIDVGAPFEWAAVEPGCYDRGISDAFWAPDQIGLTDFRIGRLPDSGQGPGLIVHFRRHLSDAFAVASNKPPDLLIVVGDWQSSCAAVIQQSACPQAEALYSSLALSSIPLNHAFDDVTGMILLHGTQYILSSRDGEGNQVNWSYYGQGHPLQQKIAAALDNLASCAKPAAGAFRRAGL